MESIAERVRFHPLSPDMKRLYLPLVILIPGLLHADSITLKNGRELKGDVINDGPDGVLIDYYVTATIKDQKLVSRDDIAVLRVVPPDEKAFSDLGDLSSPPGVLDTSFYDALIEKKIPEYLAKYPYSRHLGELRTALSKLEAERSRIRQGDRKIDGNWITASAIEADPYESKATIQFATIKEKAQANDPVGVLQGYELIEKTYPGARILPDAVDVAIKQLDLLESKLAQARTNYDILDKKRQKAIAMAPADQAKEIKDALDKDAALAKLSIATAQSDGSKFYPVFPNNKEALEGLQTLINVERARLLILQKTPMRDGINAAQEASKLASSGKTQQAKEKLATAQKLWPANHDLAMLSAQLDQMAKADAAEAARQKAQPSASPSPKK
jgi:hypothetical protein